MKKILAVILTLALSAVSLCSCFGGGNDDGDDKNKKGEISVFYYTFSDTYISSVRSNLGKILSDSGLRYNDYDANGNQTTQTEQVQTAIAKGASALVVNIVDTGSSDAAINIIELARAQNIPVIFFNRSVDEGVVSSYDKCVFIGTDYEMAGHMQGEMIGNYLVDNYNTVDINGDGKISYVMFKGQEGNMEAIARTQYGVEDCNNVLAENNLPPLEFYDASNPNKYLVDQDGLWSSAAATNYMSTILARFSEAGGNMVELIIANNDEMALGAVAALQGAGYNNGAGKNIPVFGVDATDAARSAISDGAMTGTIKQDAENMAMSIERVAVNLIEGKNAFDGIDENNIIGNWRINIPYAAYIGE